MASQALYRKWRSQTFDELVGQEHVLQTLRHAIVEERVAHAYVFTGPRGVGKTTMARLLAKAVNCTAAPDQRPCGSCEFCQAIAEGRMVDVIEMDAASHTSVEDARELIERVQFRPTSGRYKVYVIDEVHMLSTAAFNALLKTLEEPPSHAIFILATTEVHKVPATILSRCQRFTFSRHSVATTAAHLVRIAKAEGLTLEDGVAEGIARAATGSMRDALGVLEQLSSFSGGTITLDQVHSLLGMSSAAELTALIEALVNQDVTGALRAINGVAHQGVDMRQFTRDLIEQLRSLMLLIATNDSTLLDVSEDEMKCLREWSTRVDVLQVTQWVKLYSNLDYQLRTSPYGHLPLELATVEALLAPTQPSRHEAGLRRQVSSPKTPVAKPAQRQPVQASRSEQPSKSPVQPNVPPSVETIQDDREEKQPVSCPPTDKPLSPLQEQPSLYKTVKDQETLHNDNVELSLLEKVESVWNDVVRDVRPHDPNLQAFLRGVRPVDIEGSTLILQAASKFHSENIEKPRNRQIVAEVIQKHVGVTFAIRCTFEKQKKKEDLRSKIRDVRKDPLIRAAINIFDADVVGIEESKDKEKE